MSILTKKEIVFYLKIKGDIFADEYWKMLYYSGDSFAGCDLSSAFFKGNKYTAILKARKYILDNGGGDLFDDGLEDFDYGTELIDSEKSFCGCEDHKSGIKCFEPCCDYCHPQYETLEEANEAYSESFVKNDTLWLEKTFKPNIL